MKRKFRARQVALAGTLAATMALAPATASAATPALSLNFSQGSSQPTAEGDINAAGLLGAMVGLAQSANGVINEGVVPKVERNGSTINIVLDPSSIPGLAEAFAPANPGQLSPVEGRTAAGEKVVFPTSGTFTSGYGMRWGSMHNGIDVANPVGTPIYAVMSGEVISSGPAQGYGNWIRIRHDNGAVSVYGHMRADSLLVNVGDRVEAGQQIAAIGNEGQSTGPHLHFEIHPDGVNPVDPQVWFAEQGINF